MSSRVVTDCFLGDDKGDNKVLEGKLSTANVASRSAKSNAKLAEMSFQTVEAKEGLVNLFQKNGFSRFSGLTARGARLL